MLIWQGALMMSAGRKSGAYGQLRCSGGCDKARPAELSTDALLEALSTREIGSAGLLASLDEFLRIQAERTGNPAFARAANALHQQSAGRPAIDDEKLISEARWLVSTGKVKTINQALQRVARTRVDEDRVKAFAERLRRKIAQQRENRSTK